VNDLFDTLRQMIRQELGHQRVAELGLVQEVFPASPGNYDADVVLRDGQQVLRHVPVATPRKGYASLPEVGDLVLVQFVGGDLNRPVVTGTLYNGDDKPPDSQPGQWVVQLPSGPDAKTSGYRFELQQESPLMFTLTLASRFKLTVQDDDPVVSLEVSGTKLVIDQNGAIQIDCAADAKLKASGKLALEADGDVEIKAGGQMTLKGSVIKLN
jgi:uncharacterized protein involved in type VI secretion and phage assembly